MSEHNEDRVSVVGVEELREELRGKAYLFDDPGTYVAGVEDAMRAVEGWLHAGRVAEDRVIDVSDAREGARTA